MKNRLPQSSRRPDSKRTRCGLSLVVSRIERYPDTVRRMYAATGVTFTASALATNVHRVG